MATALVFNVMGHDVSASSTLQKVTGEAEKSSSRISGSFKKAGAMIAGAFAGTAAIDFFKDSIDQATESQKVGAQTAAVLKSTGQAAGISATQIGKLATAISNKAGIDDEEIQSGENMLLTFTNIRNEAGKGNDIFSQGTKIMTDMSVATGTSMKSSAVQLGKALNDPIKGISALQRVGVSFTDQQKDQIKTLVDTGNTMGAQKVILGELNKEFAGSAAAQATPAEKAKVAWGNLQEQIGTLLLPVLGKLASFITTTIIPAISTAVAWVQKHQAGFVEIGQTIEHLAVGIYRGLLLPIIKALIPVVRSIVDWVRTHQAGLSELAHVIATVVIVAVKTVIGVIKIFIGVIRTVVDVISKAVDIVKGAFHVIATAAHLMASGVAKAWHTMGAGLSWVWGNVIEPIFGLIKGGVHEAHQVVKSVAHAISQAFRGIGDGLQWAWQHTVGPVFSAIMGAIHAIQSAYNALFGGGPSQVYGPPGSAKTAAGLHGIQNNPVLQGLSSALGHNAQGIGYWRGGPTVLNELGPEVVDLPAGSRITPHTIAASQNRLASTSDTYITINLPNAYMTQAEVDRAVASAVERAVGRGATLNISRGVR